MKVARSLSELNARYGLTDVVAAFGVFDGVHRGHQRIVDNLMDLARLHDSVPIVITFDPHPRAVLHPHDPPQYLTLADQKLAILRSLGVVAAVVLEFTPEMAVLSPEQFVCRELLSDQVRLRAICAGSQWRFGAGGCGDIAFLHRTSELHRFEVRDVPELHWYGAPVSSTRIRKAIQNGRLPHAQRMLTRPHTVRGIVSRGKGIGGRELNCPTANLTDSRVLLPADGVYAARGVLCPGDSTHRSSPPMDGIVYIGHAPTIPNADGEHPHVVELHLFDFQGDLYGHSIEIQFHDFIRPDRHFRSTGALRAQIDRDIARAHRILAKAPVPETT